MAGSLEAYHAKRNFHATREPRGKVARASKTKALSFVIQKHAATRLHYDFRLELDGVLKSWAVAKGPSLVAGEKRLAVHVEDHPLDYGRFEGTIPKGEYGGGSVMLWDRGTWLPEGDPQKGYDKGHLDFSLHGEKLTGRWHLVRMRRKAKDKHENWLLIKSDDDAARSTDDPDILEDQPLSVETGRSIDEIGTDATSRVWSSAPVTKAVPKDAKKAPLPDFIAPQLAMPTETPPAGPKWIHEIKFDGYRMQGAVARGNALLRTRKGLDWTHKFKPIAQALAALPVTNAIVDGEIVIEDDKGISDFSGLQQALKSGRDDTLVYYLFDLLYLDGHDLRPLPLRERKAALEHILSDHKTGVLRLSEHFSEDGSLMLKHVCRLSAEGIVSKRIDAPYRSGRGAEWLKAKCAHQQEFVVIGFSPSTAASKTIGSLLMAYYEGQDLVFAGRVGTGFSTTLAKDLFKELNHDKTAHAPLAHVPTELRKNVIWVPPTRVAEVEFRGWTGGGLLRQASFKGLREDKDPREIIREEAAPTPRSTKNTPVPKRFPLTHPDRILWQEAGITKEALADYYASIWPQIDKHIIHRPLALVRCPTGIDHTCFFQKHAWDGMSSAIEPVKDPHDKESLVGISSLEGLIGLVQASALEIHPWGATARDLDHPDRLTLDLDPSEDVPWSALTTAARDIRDRLKAMKLTCFCKTTGGKGLHIVMPLTPSGDWDSTKAFCRTLAEHMAADQPAAYIATMSKAKRRGRIYIDYLRNGRGATAVGAWSTRARPSCGVSTPVDFDELDDLRSGDHFTLLNIGRRLAFAKEDPWAGFFRIKQKLPELQKRAQAKRARKA